MATVSQAYAATLKKIATNQMLSPEEVDELSDKKVISQAQLFTVVQARNSLIRIYKLTEFLDKFSDKFMDSALSWQSSLTAGKGLPSKTYESIFSTILSLLNYSHSVLSQLLNDNRLSSVIVDNSINIYTKDNAEVSVNNNYLNVLDSTSSRDRVRALISKVVSDINKVDGVPVSDEYVLPAPKSEDDEDDEDEEDPNNQ